MLSVIWRRTPP